jgi:two-component system LytT family response regulator
LTKISVLIVDDERPARRKIRRFLESEPDIEVLAEASSGEEAVSSIESHRPALVFLDVQMPGLDGFGVVSALGTEPLPLIVFVTAHDQFALRAFEVHALDYLLKPFDQDRFRRVLERARASLMRERVGQRDERMNRLIEELHARERYPQRLLINSEGRAFFLPVERIDRVEAAKNYVEIHAGRDAYLLRGTIEGLHRRLDPARFLRVNRSQLVNIDSIKELQPWFHGEYRILLKDGTEVMWSRRYLDRSSDIFVRQF